jgi:hypothetical protein
MLFSIDFLFHNIVWVASAVLNSFFLSATHWYLTAYGNALGTLEKGAAG